MVLQKLWWACVVCLAAQFQFQAWTEFEPELNLTLSRATNQNLSNDTNVLHIAIDFDIDSDIDFNIESNLGEDRR